MSENLFRSGRNGKRRARDMVCSNPYTVIVGYLLAVVMVIDSPKNIWAAEACIAVSLARLAYEYQEQRKS